MSKLALDMLRTRFGADILETHDAHGDETAVVTPSLWKDVCQYLRTDPALDFDMLVDLCAVDYPARAGAGQRLEVVLHLYSIKKRHRLRLKARVGDATLLGADVDSLCDVWPGANWFEREVYDMSGVTFRGHPDLRRILLYPEFVGHPLLKDYPAQRTQPLVDYRSEAEAGVPLEKLAPFHDDEGMPFDRRGLVHPDPTSLEPS
jgi:NADH-quinone oxidoreductase subunit C